jgi:hypothetical protein
MVKAFDFDTYSVISDISIDTTVGIVHISTDTKTRNPSTPPVGAKRPHNSELQREGVHELAPLGFSQHWVGHKTAKGRPGKRPKKAKFQDFVTEPYKDHKGVDRVKFVPVLGTGSVSSCSDIGVSIQHPSKKHKPDTISLALKGVKRANHPPIRVLCFDRDPLQYRLTFKHNSSHITENNSYLIPARNPLDYFDYYFDVDYHFDS